MRTCPPANPQGGSSTADGNEFLSLTQQLALSSAFGAVQCSFGPCTSVQHTGADAAAAGDVQLPPEQQQQPDMVMLVRFQEGEQLQAFLDCPPVAALLQVGSTALMWMHGILGIGRPQTLAWCGSSLEVWSVAAIWVRCAPAVGFTALVPLAPWLQGDERIPLVALWSCVLESQPSDSSSTRGVQGGLM